MDTVNTELIRGHVDTIILNSLAERDRYGYEILDIISDLSEGRYEIKQPTLYSCLKRLEKQGFITSYFGDESNGGRRRYYQLTEKGKETLEQDQREWEFSRTIINKLLSDKEIDLKTVEAPFDPNELRPLTRRIKAHDPKDDVAATEASVAPVVKYVYIPQYIHVPENQPLPESVVAPEGATVISQNEIPIGVEPENKAEFIPTPTMDQAIQALYSTTLSDDQVKSQVEEGIQMKNKLEVSSEKEVESEVDEEAALMIKEQQTKASKLLEIGEFARHRNLLEDPYLTEKSEISAENQAKQPEYINFANKGAINDEDNENFNYREALSAIFGTAQVENSSLIKEASSAYKMEAERIENTNKARHFGDVKQSLYEDGFKLKVYQKANSINHYYMKFIYSNRINRDTALLTYMLLLVELLIMIIARTTFGIALPYIIFGAIALLLPIIPTIIWLLNPTKRIRAQFNMNQTLTNATIVFIVISAITIVVSLLLDVDMKLGSTYAPIIISTNLPFGVLIYGLLYKSNNYHLKK